MGYKNSCLLCLSLFLAISSSIHALDITKLLGKYPEFATFSKYLTETKLTEEINKRNTITILAVDDGAVSALSGKSQQTVKAILSTHVILDYYDQKKLIEAQGNEQQLTTLYQSSGLAVNEQGFLKVALVGEGEIAFGSAVKGAAFNVSLVKTVTTQPYNISILQVTKLITFPGVDSLAPTPSPPSKAEAPVASPPPQSEEVIASSPSDDVTVDAPAPGPADGEAADATSNSSKSMISLVGAIMCFVSLFVVV